MFLYVSQGLRRLLLQYASKHSAKLDRVPTHGEVDALINQIRTIELRHSVAGKATQQTTFQILSQIMLA